MQRWRKSLALKHPQHASIVSSNTTKRSANEETTILKLKRQIYGEPSNRGSMMRSKVHSSRKSVPRRLSYSKHDDSISLMNIGSNLDDAMKSTPMKLETVPVVKISNSDEITKKLRADDDEELGVKKDTLEYLKSIGVIGSFNSRQKCKSPTVPVKNLSSAKKAENLLSAKKAENLLSAKKAENLSSAKKAEHLSSAKKAENLPSAKKAENLPAATKSDKTKVDNLKETFCQWQNVSLELSISDEVKEHIQNVNIKEFQNDNNLISLQQKMKELLMKQMKEKRELRERYEKEIIKLEKDHEKEMIDLFNPAETNTSEPVALAVTDISMPANHLSQEINISHDSFFKSPISGTRKVSHDDDDVLVKDTPTPCLKSVNSLTIHGQEFLDTPATRRLVTRRITKNIETLFLK